MTARPALSLACGCAQSLAIQALRVKGAWAGPAERAGGAFSIRSGVGRDPTAHLGLWGSLVWRVMQAMSSLSSYNQISRPGSSRTSPIARVRDGLACHPI